ncbi:ubiquitin carboxyl-terminal hydrolase-like protein [Zalerion maritima]|uniref:Ubiquitin carboxyl-terminal hydrolase-like protein n=1 Tax=Zalerion maritima TaxID=339359 RepID=A0AAD5RX31_9PEZI|nr:ubiquitin carboxyl-terminal hydrolase-like protein [Zalerion maritima]
MTKSNPKSPPPGGDAASHAHQLPPVDLLTDQLETPSLDDRSYRVVRLQNKLEVLIVHDPSADKASASIDVNVGSYRDEDDMPGRAHAVEHLLFMGTKKFPEENAYSQYLSSHSGSSNAYTGATSTNYYFEVGAKPSDDKEPSAANPSPLYGALDRFAQFFVQPLFLASTLDRELRAVDSENKKNLQSDQWRLHQLDRSLSNLKHPYHKFSTGNYDLLKTQPEAKGINVRDKFIQFYETDYSANLMRLVVLGREPLDVLQDWVAELFTPVPNKNLPEKKWDKEEPLGPADLGTQCFARPVMESRELNLTFPFIDEEMLYESQPSRYIGHLVGHEGPGSIMSYIKGKGWANGLSAGTWPVCPGTPGIFDCQIRLTEEGLKNYKEIVKVVFQYIAMLRETPPQEWIFEELKLIGDVDFKFKQKTRASGFTSKLSAVMQKPIPREWLLSGHSRVRKFDPKAISRGISQLRPDNFRMTIVSQTFPGNWDKKEKWYGTEYRYERIPEDFMTEIRLAADSSASKRLDCLHLPHKNQFIPTKLEVEKKDVKEKALAPRLIRNDAVARTWFKKDDTYWVPKANLIVCGKNPIIYATAENCVKARLYTDMVRDALEEYSYDAELSGLQYSVALDSRGLFIEVSGYNDKLAVLLEHVLVTMRDIEIKEDRFQIIKERLSRGYRNWELQQPFHQMWDYTSFLLTMEDYLVEDLIAELPGATVDSIRVFKEQILSQLHFDIYVLGNLYREDALKLTDMIQSTLKPRILPESQWPVLRSLIFPPGSNYSYHKTLKDPANVNNCLEYWLYVGDRGDLDIRTKTLLFEQIAHEPAFDQLRTKEQLGYVVFTGVRGGHTTYGYRVLIQSERTPEYLEYRVDAFLESMKSRLGEMSDEDFEKHKRSLVIKRLEKLRDLDLETSRHWNQIHSEYCNFELAQQDAERVKLLTKKDVAEFYNEFIDPASARRAKVSVSLHAQASGGAMSDSASELGTTLSLDSAATEEVKKLLVAAGGDKSKAAPVMKTYLVEKARVAAEKADSALDGWIKSPEPASNGTIPAEVRDFREYKSRLAATRGAYPVKDLTEQPSVKCPTFYDFAAPYARPTRVTFRDAVHSSLPPSRLISKSKSALSTTLPHPFDAADRAHIIASGNIGTTSKSSLSPKCLLSVKCPHQAQVSLDPEKRLDHLPACACASALVFQHLPFHTANTITLLPRQTVLPPELPSCGSPFITSSAKKRRFSPPTEQDRDPDSLSDIPLPSCEEPDADPAFSFSGVPTSVTPAPDATTPSYLRADSQPASSLPPRLQTQSSTLAPTDNAWSAASSPSAAYAELSIDSDRETRETTSSAIYLSHPTTAQRRSKSPGLRKLPQRAIIGEAGDIHHRSSSPLKRRASSMDPDVDQKDASSSPKEEDVDMITVPEPSFTTVTANSTTSVIQTRAVSVELTDAPTSDAIPPIEEQVKTIKTLIDASDATPLEDGQKTYLISMSWLSQAMALAEGKPVPKESTHPESLGPVDNSDIVEEFMVDAAGKHFSILKPGMTQAQFKYLPEDAWNLIVEWHQLTPGQFPILRVAHNTADTGENIQIENYPPVFKLHRVWSATTPIAIDQKLKQDNPSAPRLVQPTGSLFNDFLKEVKELLSVELVRKVRVWRVPQKLPAGNSTPIQGPQDSWNLLVDVSDFTQLEDGDQRDKVDCKDQTANPNYNGKSMTLALAGLGTSMSIVLDEEVENGTFVTTFTTQAASCKAKGPKTTLSLQARPSGSGRSSPALGHITRGRTTNARPGRLTGTAGLQNLGNTCYMNSALQCLRSVEELTKYFLTNEAEKEINTTNVLGHNGDIAHAYGKLLEQFYADNNSGYVVPRQFKAIVGRYGPMFSGYGQQDSQEFLGFLLDGLQEDLSRVKKKPYIEKPDSTDDMINNPKLIAEMAEQVWDITRKRDDSVIADLFVGMYKSTLVCPVCSKVSITFDPFNNLTLQLPVKSSFRRSIRFFPLNDRPVILAIDIDRNSNIRGLKEFVALRAGTTSDKLIVAENFGHKFYAIYKDGDGPVHDKIQNNDHIDVFELEHKPTNWPDPRPVKKKPKLSGWAGYSTDDAENKAPHWDDPMAEHMVVPVLYRKLGRPSQWNGTKRTVFDPPHFIILTPQEARSEDMIRRKVLQKLATFSTWEAFKSETDGNISESTDPELIPSGGSDGDSSRGGKVQANSVDGEDDMVDVTMDKQPNGTILPSHYPLKHFNKETPSWAANPDEFLQPQLQNLFQLCYFSEDNMLPKGSHPDHEYPPLSQRVPVSSAPSVANGTESDAEEDEDNAGDEENVQQTRMAEESDDEGPTGGPIRKGQKHVRNQRGRRKGKNKKTYGKKNKQRQIRNRQPKTSFLRQQQFDDEDDGGDGPLVRLGEGILVDFTEQAYYNVFENGLDLNPSKAGSASLVTLVDPEILAREKELEHRRRNGITLDMCLEEFEKEEILAEEDQWYCPRCKDHVRASKKFELWKTPDILIVHLKRFSNSGYRRDKIDITVDFEIEGLDLTHRVIDKTDGKEEIYDLIAVDNHWGGLGGGHYTAVAKNFLDGQWYDYNDSSVSKSGNKSNIVSNSAYLLFYRRRSAKPLGGPRFQDIFRHFEGGNDAEDETETDAGEDQRLANDCSHPGSSGALMGAGVSLHPGTHGLGSADVFERGSGDVNSFSTFPDMDPSGHDAVNSIEQDEGIGDIQGPVSEHSAHYSQDWTFRNVTGDNITQATEDDADSTQAVGSDRNSVIDTDDGPSFTNTEDILPTAWDSTMSAAENTPGAVFIQQPEMEDGPAAEIRLESDNEDDVAAPLPVVPRGRTPGSN